MSVTLAKGATSVTLPGPKFPFSEPNRTGVIAFYTQGGELIREKKGERTIEKRFLWEYLTPAEKEALENFLITTIRGGLDSFTYTNVDSTEYTAYWLDEAFEPIMPKESRWNVTLTFRLEP